MSEGEIVSHIIYMKFRRSHSWIHLPRQVCRCKVPRADQYGPILVYIIRSTSWLTQKDVIHVILATVDEFLNFLHPIQWSVQTSAVNPIQKNNPYSVVPGRQSWDISFNFRPIVGEGDDIFIPKIKLLRRATVEYGRNQHQNLTNWTISN